MVMVNNDAAFIGYEKYVMDQFEFESGKVLENVEVEFSAKGTPKYDDDGNINNAIVYCHQFTGDYASLNDIYKLTAQGKPFDFDEYYFISITKLGFPDSCSPSTTNLKHKFPQYTIKDRVNFNRQFLKERFNLDKVFGVIGKGLGGYEVYTWACEYPDEMDFIMAVGTCFKTNGYRYVISKCMESIIESSDDFYSDVYSDSLSRMMVSVNRLMYSNYFSKRLFQTMSNDEIDVLMDDFVNEGLFIDIYDFKFNNDVILGYDIESKLGNIKAETLIVSSDADMYYTPEFDVLPLEDLIENSTVIIFNAPEEQIDYNDCSIIEKDIENFLNKIKNK